MLNSLGRLKKIDGARLALTTEEQVSAQARCPLPSSLTSVSYRVPDGDLGGGTMLSVALRNLRTCKSLTSCSLTAFFDQEEYEDEVEKWDLSALAHLQQLRVLRIEGFPPDHVDPTAQAAIKTLSCLEVLQIVTAKRAMDWDGMLEWSQELLPNLLSAPHSLVHLREFPLSDVSVFEDEALLLGTLPALACCQPYFFFVGACPLLAQLPALRSLSLPMQRDRNRDMIDDQEQDLLDERGYTRGSAIVPQLTCAGLTELRMEDCVFTAEQAIQLCNTLPRLIKMVLQDVGWPSLESLRLLACLRVFELRPARHVSFAFSLEHVKPLKRLRSLKLLKLSAALDAATVAALQPPCTLMPLLKIFKHSTA